MRADDLARRILVRHREAGHLRLELPAVICHAAAGQAMAAAVRAVPGVYRVVFQAAERRLAVHFDARLCHAGDVARALRASLDSLPLAPDADPGSAVPAPAADPTAAARQALREAAARTRGAWRDLRTSLAHTVRPGAPGGSLQARLQPMLANALTEKAIVNFLNDLIAFYLVKVHWELISQRWLKNPVKHADAWLAIFYLMFLLVRYRKSIAVPALPVNAGEPATP